MLVDRIVYGIVLLFGWTCRLLTKKMAMSLGRVIGTLLYLTLKKRKEIALENLRIAFGEELDEKERCKICRESYVNLSKTIIEFMRFPKFNAENIWSEVKVVGREYLNIVLEEGKGVIVFLPHFGNWELLSLVYGALIPNQAKAIAFPLKNKLLNEMIWGYRELLSLELIPKNMAVRSSLRALRDNYAVGFFADQNAGNQGVFIDFFGKPASAARGPVALALKTGAPILFSLDIRKPNDQHIVEISPPIYLNSSDDIEQDIKLYTSKLLERLESYINQYPEQWLWIHNRWKSQPLN